MLFSQSTLLLALSTSAAAAPYERSWFGGLRRSLGGWGSSDSWQHMSNTISSAIARRDNLASFGSDTSSSCANLANVQLPQSLLQAPSSNMTLYHVAVGRGTQNYTCDFTNATAVPTAIGATANLYNADCSASCPTLSQNLPIYLLQGMKYPPSPSAPTTSLLIGHHFFSDNTTAYFDLDDANASWGQGGFAKIDSVNAPAGAAMGKGKQQHGAVAWLKLAAKETLQQCPFQEVYRVNTAGGMPPPSCKDLNKHQRGEVEKQGAFTIQYSAEYWFYS